MFEPLRFTFRQLAIIERVAVQMVASEAPDALSVVACNRCGTAHGWSDCMVSRQVPGFINRLPFSEAVHRATGSDSRET